MWVVYVAFFVPCSHCMPQGNNRTIVSLCHTKWTWNEDCGVITSVQKRKDRVWEVITWMSPNENKPHTVPTACKMWELSSGMLKEVYELSLSHKRKPVLLVTLGAPEASLCTTWQNVQGRKRSSYSMTVLVSALLGCKWRGFRRQGTSPIHPTTICIDF